MVTGGNDRGGVRTGVHGRGHMGTERQDMGSALTGGRTRLTGVLQRADKNKKQTHRHSLFFVLLHFSLY